MTIYKVPIIGDGLTLETAFRPDIPSDIAWSAVNIDAENYVECFIETDENLVAHPLVEAEEVDISSLGILKRSG